MKRLFTVLFGISLVSMLGIALLARLGPAVDVDMIWHAATGQGGETPSQPLIEQRLQVPPGFKVDLYAADLPGVRMMAFSQRGDLVITQPRKSQIVLLPYGSTEPQVLLGALTRPQSVAFHDGYLYVAESNAIGRIRFDHDKGSTQGQYQHIVTGLSDSGNHWTKTLGFGPDNKLYITSGSTCNVCDESDPQRATMLRYNPDGSDGEIYATGLRNSVGFDWHPQTKALYATDNGRDLLGDDYPPCELNRIEQNAFYGWPYINGFGDLDPDLGQGKEKLLETAHSPVYGFKAHNAPLGMSFISSQQWPDDYRNNMLVALHGSWNRSSKDGYKVVRLTEQENGSFIETDFLAGFEKDDTVIGRPVDVKPGPDDCVYVSDDYAGAVYRICYGEAKPLLKAKTQTAQPSTPTNGLNSNPELIALGKTIFTEQQCLQCHTLGTKTRFGMVALYKLAARYDNDSLQQFLQTPTPPMPAVNLPKAQQQALIQYLLQL